MSNAASAINVLTERDLLTPSSGYHCSLFANYTLDGIKAILLCSMTSTTGGPCAQWDSHASRALSHSAFQPFTWPVMFDTSARILRSRESPWESLGAQRSGSRGE